MKNIKYSFQADAVGNLYRSSLFLAKGNIDLGLTFLKQASLRLTDIENNSQVSRLIKNPKLLRSSKDQLYWAEKILDQYTFFKSKFL